MVRVPLLSSLYQQFLILINHQLTHIFNLLCSILLTIMSSDNTSKTSNATISDDGRDQYTITTRSVSQRTHNNSTPSKRDAVIELTKNNNDFEETNEASSSKKQCYPNRTLQYFSNRQNSDESPCSFSSKTTGSTLSLSQASDTSSQVSHSQPSEDNSLRDLYSSSVRKTERFCNFDEPHSDTSLNYSLMKRAGTNSNVWDYFHI